MSTKTKKSTYFSDIEVAGDRLKFTLSNVAGDVPIPLANAIRRTLYTDIPGFIIDPKNVDFEKNTSVLNNDFLAHRIGLIPLRTEFLLEKDPTTLRASLDMKNETTETINITLESLRVGPHSAEEALVSDGVLLGKLRPGQELKFSAPIIDGTARTDAAFAAACLSQYGFQPVDKENPVIREYGRSGVDPTEPDAYLFEVESIGGYQVQVLPGVALQVLIELMTSFKNNIIEGRTELVEVGSADTNFPATAFVVYNEDHTLGNLLSWFLQRDEAVSFAGYEIPHPLEPKLVITVALKSENPEGVSDGAAELQPKVEERVLATVDTIIGLLEKLEKDWSAGVAKL